MVLRKAAHILKSCFLSLILLVIFSPKLMSAVCPIRRFVCLFCFYLILFIFSHKFPLSKFSLTNSRSPNLVSAVCSLPSRWILLAFPHLWLSHPPKGVDARWSEKMKSICTIVQFYTYIYICIRIYAHFFSILFSYTLPRDAGLMLVWKDEEKAMSGLDLVFLFVFERSTFVLHPHPKIFDNGLKGL